MRQKLVIALLLAGCAFLISFVYNPISLTPGYGGESSAPAIEIAGRTVSVIVADTARSREQGLSGRAGLGTDEGMLFVFPQDGVYPIWMKDMRFSIDILWVSSSGVIVDIRERAAPESYPEIFTPRGEARYVVELPAGWVSRHGVAVGDTVRI